MIESAVGPQTPASKKPRRWLDKLSKGLLLFSLCLASLLYGVVAGHYGLFPHQQLKDAKAGAEALVAVLSGEPPPNPIDVPGFSTTEPSVKNHAERDDGALILVSGGPGYYRSLHPDGCLAWLINRQGRIVHSWKYDDELWAGMSHVKTIPGVSQIYPVGMHLLPDGGLIVTFQAIASWPFAVGMARFDKDSNLIWKTPCHAHHWFVVTPDDTIITPTLRLLESPATIGDSRGRIIADEGKAILADAVTVMSLDGDVLEEISILDALDRSGLIGLYQGGAVESIWIQTNDPLHLNAVRPVSADVAAAHEWLNAGDLMISLRSLNSVAILDRATAEVKWLCAGKTLRQHNPRFFGTDHILVFDNLGGNESLGGTRIVKVGLETLETETVFPTTENPPDHPVYSYASGHLDLSPDQSRVLMAVTEQSMILEVDTQTGELLWEYRFVDPDTQKPQPIHTAKYCYDVAFEMNQTESGE